MIRVEIAGVLEVEDDGSVVFRINGVDNPTRQFKFPVRPNGPDALSAINGLAPWLIEKFQEEVSRAVARLTEVGKKKG